MKILFFGLGSIGKRHARLLQQNHNFELAAFKSLKSNKNNELGIAEIYDWNQVKEFNPSVAFITNPTSLHIKTALRCTELNCALFIEKPIGANLTDLEEVVKIVSENKIVTYIAYNLRFHPVVEELKNYCSKYNMNHYRSVCTSYLPNWRPGVNHKEHYSAQKDKGGGVILELSHEIDLAHYLLNGLLSIKGICGKKGKVTADAEEYADINIESSKVNGFIHLNFFSHKVTRTIDIDFYDFSVRGDLIDNTIMEFKNGKETYRKKFELNRDTTYLKQLAYFFDNINNYQMNNNLIEAADLYQKIVNFRESSSNG